MSFTFFDTGKAFSSEQTNIFSYSHINYSKAHVSYEVIQSELSIVNSYLNLEQWNKKNRFRDQLKAKCEQAQLLKNRLMKKYGVNNIKDIMGFRCQFCTKVFNLPTALGGHVSKVHSSLGSNTKNKQIKRKDIKFIQNQQQIEELRVSQMKQNKEINEKVYVSDSRSNQQECFVQNSNQQYENNKYVQEQITGIKQNNFISSQ